MDKNIIIGLRDLCEERFGKATANRITDEQLTEAWQFAFRCSFNLTSKHGKQPNGTFNEIFFTYLHFRWLK